MAGAECTGAPAVKDERRLEGGANPLPLLLKLPPAAVELGGSGIFEFPGGRRLPGRGGEAVGGGDLLDGSAVGEVLGGVMGG